MNIFINMKFIITEEEKSRIRGLYEMVGDKLSPQGLQSPKAQGTKKQSTFLNQYYNMNLSSATTGSWTDKDFNDTLKKFMEEKGVPVHICKKGDGYCADGDEGEVTTKEMGKLNQAMGFLQEDKSDTFLDQFARLYGVTSEEASNINFSSSQTQMDIAKNTLMGSLKKPTFEYARERRLDRLLQELLSFYKGETGLKGSVSEEQKIWLNNFIETLKSIKHQIEKYVQNLSQEEFEKLWRPLTYSNEPPSTEEKINTTNDSTYDYKLSGDKYYYSLKGQNNWIEAIGKGLASIKSKVTFY